MDVRRAAAESVPRPRTTWTRFGAVSALVLAACVAGALSAGTWPRAIVIIATGLVAVGLAAFWMIAILSPLPGNRGPAQRRPGQGAVIGGFGGGGGTAGGCGDSGGGC